MADHDFLAAYAAGLNIESKNDFYLPQYSLGKITSPTKGPLMRGSTMRELANVSATKGAPMRGSSMRELNNS
eukprot:7573518-Pyramimonas_sp.AAC.2